jgi:mannose-6-phosphate isomerase-like protein (cupin superfamily)
VTDYDIHLDDRFGSLTLIDVRAEIAAHEPWFNETLTTVNDAVVRLGVIEGDFHWHHHDDTDEFFLVLDGQFDIALRDADGRETEVVLRKGDTFVVPKGTEHKPSSPGGSILMFEPSGTMSTGDRHEEVPDHVDSTVGHELG